VKWAGIVLWGWGPPFYSSDSPMSQGQSLARPASALAHCLHSLTTTHGSNVSSQHVTLHKAELWVSLFRCIQCRSPPIPQTPKRTGNQLKGSWHLCQHVVMRKKEMARAISGVCGWLSVGSTSGLMAAPGYGERNSWILCSTSAMNRKAGSSSG